MIRVTVMGNDLPLVDVIASILVMEMETPPDVLQLTYHLPLNIDGLIIDPRSLLIVIDEGESENQAINVPGSFRQNNPLLLIKALLKTRNIDVHECYQLTKPGMEQAIELVMNFIDTNLKKKKGYAFRFAQSDYNTSASNAQFHSISST